MIKMNSFFPLRAGILSDVKKVPLLGYGNHMMAKEIDLIQHAGKSHIVWSKTSRHEEELLWNLSLHLTPGMVFFVSVSS